MKLNVETFKKGARVVGNFAKKACVVIGPMVVAAMYDNSTRQTVTELRYIGEVDYGDTISAITNSRMSDYYKANAAKLVQKNQDSGYYKAVVNTVCSRMSDYYKVEMIKQLNNNNKEEKES